jgi:hypothetical protein
LLLPRGLPIEDGRKLLADHGDVLIEEVEPYIEASIAADDERKRKELAAATEQAEVARQLAEKRARLAQAARRGYALGIVFAVIALLATGLFGFQQKEAKQAAARDRDTASSACWKPKWPALVFWQSCRRIERLRATQRPACSWRSRQCQPT